jgi:hypothetical protein
VADHAEYARDSLRRNVRMLALRPLDGTSWNPPLCTGGVFSGTVFLDGMPTAHDDLSDARAVFGSRCRDVRSEI